MPDTSRSHDGGRVCLLAPVRPRRTLPTHWGGGDDAPADKTGLVHLESSTVHVWLTFSDQVTDAALLHAYRELLDPEERHRLERFCVRPPPPRVPGGARPATDSPLPLCARRAVGLDVYAPARPASRNWRSPPGHRPPLLKTCRTPAA